MIYYQNNISFLFNSLNFYSIWSIEVINRIFQRQVINFNFLNIQEMSSAVKIKSP
ncbi:hypothetical protein MYP_4363 [Sporocytophaga myxococcoides]|uniref:Uncharacterized protein n=1 Tax=Sporocytophaga myxococcoides TaxID=153721 RepID=A0A098LLV8_9BACT|nr:hypothetical protein MYP_4363 [Sporocytophaga myxococcoides]